MEPYEKFWSLCSILGKDTVCNAIEKILSTDQLDELCEDIAKEYDIDFDGDEEDEDDFADDDE